MADERDAKTDAAEEQGKQRRRSTAARSAKNRKSSTKNPTTTTTTTRRRIAGSSASGRYGTTVKKSVTLRGTVVQEIEARTGARGFSQFLDAAAERHLALLKAQEIVDDHTARHGQFTDEELMEAEAAWRGE